MFETLKGRFVVKTLKYFLRQKLIFINKPMLTNFNPNESSPISDSPRSEPEKDAANVTGSELP